MRASHGSRVAAVALALGACGLPRAGLGPSEAGDDGGAGDDAQLTVDAAGGDDATASDDGSGGDSTAGEAGTKDGPVADGTSSGGPVDAPPDVPACMPIDAGVLGALPLTGFSTTGAASYDENSDGKITLTNSNNDEAGAAWYRNQLPPVVAYDLTWTLRVGPGDTAGDGITFALLDMNAVPGVGDSGDGLGLRNVIMGGAQGSGYAVAVDMYKDPADPTDTGTTTLKIILMPAFKVVAFTGTTDALNDGNLHDVDVSWKAPTLTATLHRPNGSTITVASSDPGLALGGPAYLGFTGATGGASDSHNEVAGITVHDLCQ